MNIQQQSTMFTTLEEAKNEFNNDIREIISTGSKEMVECKCCTHLYKVYKRNINSGMAMTLIRMHRAAGTDYVHVLDLLKELKFLSGDFPKLRFWGFIQESAAHETNKGKQAGFWRITPTGDDFLKNQTMCVKYVHILNNSVVGYSGKNVSIKDCLTDKFDYQELMDR